MKEYIKDKLREGLNEAILPHEIKSKQYWIQILGGNQYGLKILNTIMSKQGGFASDRQMEVLRRIERGDKTPYHSKN